MAPMTQDDYPASIRRMAEVTGEPVDTTMRNFQSLLAAVRAAGGEFGMAVGRDDDGVVVDVQIAAIGECAAALVEVVERWHTEWVESDRR